MWTPSATVLFSHRFEDFPLIITNFEGRQTVRCTSPVSGENLQNISITGDGGVRRAGGFLAAGEEGKVQPGAMGQTDQIGRILRRQRENLVSK